jgi:tetratricopeptide (TPR) repeat protein
MPDLRLLVLTNFDGRVRRGLSYEELMNAGSRGRLFHFSLAKDPRTGLRLLMIAASLVPLFLTIWSFQAFGQFVGRILVLLVGVPLGFILVPFLWDMAAQAAAWILTGGVSERALKEKKSFDRARGLVKRDKLREAVAEQRAELAKDPTQWHGYKELADVLEKLGDVEPAIAELMRALPHVEDAEQQALIQLRVVDLQCRLGKIESAHTLLAQMERQTWPERIARAIQTRRQRL